MAHHLLLAAVGFLSPFLVSSCSQEGDAAAAPPEVEEVEAHAPARALPGAKPHPPELRHRLKAALRAKGRDYEPRSEHLLPDGRPQFTNRLILQNSPYLIQHAHNPVDWFPWGPEAFELAVREQKPIFLSIGYSTCHWCHVMERESFDNVEIARLMNEMFISIKVDREERPDLDEIYMTAVQLTTGRGGWPMSSFLTTEGKPFFGATYFPPDRFTALLNQINDAWHNQQAALLESADKIATAVTQVTASRGQAEEFGREAIEKGVRQILARHDKEYGGFSRAPKFPNEPDLLLLLDWALRSGDEEALGAADMSLDAMARGGIYDQVGGGFHRYSTDTYWLVPHFEKMLYNQAHLGRAYLFAYRLTGKLSHARVARQTLDYVLRDMTSPQGGFYSATDADSEGKEGEFFVWTAEELREILDPEDAELAIQLYGVSEGGNFEGKNILHLAQPLESFAADRRMPLPKLHQRVDHIREKLRQVREGRVHPLRDDKVLTAWNGMMITTLAHGAEILGEDRYLRAAARAAEFLWSHNRRGEGDLWRVHLDGNSSIPAVQEDYAYLAEALLTLWDVTGEGVWLERGLEVMEGMLERFWDQEHGGFFMSAEKVDPHMIARPKSPTDAAIPSGNSVAVRSLAMLVSRSGEITYRRKTSATLNAFGTVIQRRPSAFSYMLVGAGEFFEGAAAPRQYGAAGAVAATGRLKSRAGGALELEVDLRIRDGWHINAHKPLQENLIPTVLDVDGGRRGWSLDSVNYPRPERVRLSFQQEPLAVYQGRTRLNAHLTWEDEGSLGEIPVVPARLKIQACDDRACLQPEELVMEVPAAVLLRGDS